LKHRIHHYRAAAGPGPGRRISPGSCAGPFESIAATTLRAILGRGRFLQPPHPFLERVLVRNYTSIAACDVWLKPLNFFVGPNGSGKSNFLDAIDFVADGLSASLDHALRIRGGIDDVQASLAWPPQPFRHPASVRSKDGTAGHYAFEIGATAGGGFEVREEQCAVTESRAGPCFLQSQKRRSPRILVRFPARVFK